MPQPLILADENIPYAREAFGRLGAVRTFAGRTVTAAEVRAADVLLVRSVTKVGPELLEGSRVRFVGTATIGVEHVAAEYLAARQIGFASAQGSNARSVAEYVMTALLVLARRRGFTLAGRTLGIVGVGNVGRQVELLARGLGLAVLLNDPPLARQTGDAKYRPLAELLERAEIITFHVPFEKGGTDPTHHLIDARLLSRLRLDAILLNTSRGGVADNPALLAAIRAGKLGPVVLDVWEGEPAISPELLAAVALATPHIAGYSLDGKANGTQMLFDALARFLGESARWEPAEVLPPTPVPELDLDAAGRDEEELLLRAATALYEIEADDARLRRTLALAPAERGPYFDRLRKEYPVRREFGGTLVRLAGGSKSLRARLAGIGFRV